MENILLFDNVKSYGPLNNWICLYSSGKPLNLVTNLVAPEMTAKSL